MRNHRKALFGRGVLIRQMLPREMACCDASERSWKVGKMLPVRYSATSSESPGCFKQDNKLESRKDAAPVALLDFGGTAFPAVEA